MILRNMEIACIFWGSTISQDIHKWTGDDGRVHICPWHPQFFCSCGKCDKGGKVVGLQVLGFQVVGHRVLVHCVVGH